ncbi:MAG: universal stress protein [Gammaproteobacteria bacterium]
MTRIKHVLVATDGSEGSRKAAGVAGELARGLGARVSVLMVQSEELIMPHAWGAGEYPAASPWGAMSVDEIRQLIESRAAEKELPETAAALGELAAPPTLVQRWGHAAEEVCRFAEDEQVDLVVIGSHGRSGLKRVLLGSVSNAVVNHAPCPVTIVR